MSAFVLVLRSLTWKTGALIGVGAAVAYLAGAFVADGIFGRPSPNEWVGNILFGLPILGVFLSVVGAIGGLVVQFVVSRTRHAGPVSWRSVVALLAVTGLLASLIGARFVRNREALNRPRVLHATGAVTPLAGPSSMALEAEAMRVFDPLGFGPREELTWDRAPVSLSLSRSRDQLTIRRGDRDVDSVDMRGLDYVNEVLATTATLDGGREWLAVLVRLRSTGHRELLLIYDADAIPVHKELLERTRWQTPALAAAGERGQRQEFVINLGQPQRFTAAK